MVDAGIITEDERIELVEGELVVMAANGYAHELIKSTLIEGFVRAAGRDVRLGVKSVEYSSSRAFCSSRTLCS